MVPVFARCLNDARRERERDGNERHAGRHHFVLELCLHTPAATAAVELLVR
jgi:hypothetical protein